MKTLRHLVLAALLAASASAAGAASAPGGEHLELPGNTTSGGSGHGYLEVPHSSALNPTGGFTLEAWVFVDTDGSDACGTVAGKGFTTAWWVGICDNVLRSYLRGAGSSFTSGTVPDGEWTHIAVTYDLAIHRHYVNGVLVGWRVESGAPTTNTRDLRIGSDENWLYSLGGAIDEVRLWNVARTPAQILNNYTSQIRGAQTGLVAVWGLDGDGDADVGAYDATVVAGDYEFAAIEPPAGEWLTTPELPGYRFKVRIGTSTVGTRVTDCVPETLCVAGAIPTRAEVFVRIVGPKPNGYLWPNVIKFSTSSVELWVEKIASGDLQYYRLAGAEPDVDVLPGLFDREGFLP